MSTTRGKRRVARSTPSDGHLARVLAGACRCGECEERRRFAERHVPDWVALWERERAAVDATELEACEAARRAAAERRHRRRVVGLHGVVVGLVCAVVYAVGVGEVVEVVGRALLTAVVLVATAGLAVASGRGSAVEG